MFSERTPWWLHPHFRGFLCVSTHEQVMAAAVKNLSVSCDIADHVFAPKIAI
jgi:hypothetical protein